MDKDRLVKELRGLGHTGADSEILATFVSNGRECKLLDSDEIDELIELASDCDHFIELTDSLVGKLCDSIAYIYQEVTNELASSHSA